MELGLRGRRAVVTGASKGIGLAVVRALAAEGVEVVAGARHAAPELDALPGVRSVAVDLADPDGPGRLVTAAGEPVDILVNNVGSAPARPGGFLSVTDEDWAATLNLDLMAAVRACRAVLPGMLERGAGVVVSVASVNAVLPDPNVIDYSAAKAALANLAKSLSKEVGPRGVRVVTVSPGPVATDLWLGAGGVAATVAAATGLDPAQVAKGAAAQSVTGRFSRPEEVADLVVWLASDRAANVTGADVRIDGGLVTTL